MKINLLCLLILASNICFSQTKFLPGKISFISGDTINADIAYGQWEVNPTQINVKHDGKLFTYQVKDLSSFSIDGADHYRQFNVTYYLSAATLENAKRDFGASRDSSVSWLRLIYKGVTELYELNTKERKYFFILNNQGGVDELVYRVRVLDNLLYEDEMYKQQLSSFIPIDKNKENMFVDLRYNETKILNFLNKIEPSILDENVLVKSKNKPMREILLTAGVLPFTKRVYDTYFTNGPAFSAGFAYNFFSKRQFGKNFIRLGTNLNNFQFKRHSLQSNGSIKDTTISAFSLDFSAGAGIVFNPLALIKQSLTFEAAFNLNIGDVWDESNEFGFGRFTVRYLIKSKIGSFGPSISLITHNTFFKNQVPKFIAINYAVQF